MESNINVTTSEQRNPAFATSFRMPTGMTARGCAYLAATGRTTDLTGTRVSVVDFTVRIKAVATKGHVAFAHVPGSHAWSPPI